jgi:hypothetical protein
MTRLSGTFEIAGWDETTLHESEGGAKTTRAVVQQGFTGDVEGKGEVQWLMCYRPDGTARFVGMQRIEGVIGEQRGAFVAETAGDFDGGKARGEWTIVTGSGEGGLAGIEGSGGFEAPHGSTADFTLEYTIT